MFNLEYPRAYTWNDIFIVLSWSEFDTYLQEIVFPLVADILVIRPIAREFVLNFNKIRPVYSTKRVSDEAHYLFEVTFRSLKAEIGEERIRLLSQWGNQLHVDPRLGRAMQLNIDIISLLATETNGPSKTELSTLSTTGQQFLQALLQRYKEETKQVDNALDVFDERTVHDDWGETLIRIYKNFDTQAVADDKNIMNPTDVIAAWIFFFRAKSFFQALKRSLSDVDYKALNTLMQSHPKWIKAHSRPSTVYYQPLDLFDLADQP